MSVELEGLAARVEQATGPDRALDAEIGVAMGVQGEPWGCIRPFGPVVAGSIRDPNNRRGALAFAQFTASLDAAMTLVPEGWRVSKLIEDWRSGRWHAQLAQRVGAELLRAFDEGRTIGWETADTEQNGGATPALALTAACLRARAAQVIS